MAASRTDAGVVRSGLAASQRKRETVPGLAASCPLKTAASPHPACEADDYWISSSRQSFCPGKTAAAGNPHPTLLIDVHRRRFPGLALAIALPQAQVTLVDSVAAKAKPLRPWPIAWV